MMNRYFRFAALMLCACMTLSAPCLSAGWKLVFADDFNRLEPGSNWKATAGEIRVVDGALEIRSKGVGKAMLAGSYPFDVKVVYTAWTPVGVQRCDLTTLINTDDEGGNTGYFIGYGSWMDTLNHILKDGNQEIVASRDYLIGANDRKHRIEAVNDSGHVYLNVDGCRVLDVHDPDPCGGAGEDRIGFYTWCSAMRIDDLKVYVKSSVPRSPGETELTLPIESGPDGKLVCSQKRLHPKISTAIELFNSGRINDAYEALKNAPASLTKAAMLAWVVGHVDFTADRKGTLALLECLRNLPKTPQIRTLETQTRRLAVLAGAVEGNRTHYLPRLLNSINPGHPFHDKALLYQARFYAWQYMEDIKPRPWERSDAILKPLLAKYPNNRIIRMYLGECVPWERNVSCRDPKAPVWARELCETYLRSLAVIEWWGANRQSSDGSVGGGWGDDVELLRTWGPIAAIADGNAFVQNTIRRMVDGVWHSDSIRGTGYDTFRSDVEHSAEPSSDTQPMMLYLAYGDPEYVERNLITAKLFRDKLMGRNKFGHWHWRSNQMSSDGPSENPKYAVDVPYSCRAFRHVLWLDWYSRNPASTRLLLDWARSWAEDTMRSGSGKPVGVVPAAVGFEDDCLSGTSEKWWEPDLGWDYYNWNGGSWMYDIFALAYSRKPDDVYLAPIRAALDFKSFATSETPSWVIEKMTSRAIDDATKAMRLYELLTGDNKFRDITQGKGGTYERFLESGKRDGLLKLIRTLRESMEGNFEMLTSEVISTDRAGIWCSEDLLRIYCGTPMIWNDTRPPLMSVRWSSPIDNFAAVVTETTPISLKAILYSFAEKPIKMNAYTFRLKPGVYKLRVGSDADDDWVLDSPDRTTFVTIAHRGDGFGFDLLPGRQLAIELRLHKPLTMPEGPLPDLAINPRDIKRAGNVLNVTVHNIGGADAGPFTIKVLDAKTGRVLAVAGSAGLKYPFDLVRKTVQIQMRVPGNFNQAKVLIDYPGPEITRRNNIALINR